MAMTAQQRRLAENYIAQWRMRRQHKRLLESLDNVKPLVSEREQELSQLLLNQVSESYGKAG